MTFGDLSAASSGSRGYSHSIVSINRKFLISNENSAISKLDAESVSVKKLRF
jgi:hypothetical protein